MVCAQRKYCLIQSGSDLLSFPSFFCPLMNAIHFFMTFCTPFRSVMLPHFSLVHRTRSQPLLDQDNPHQLTLCALCVGICTKYVKNMLVRKNAKKISYPNEGLNVANELDFHIAMHGPIQSLPTTFTRLFCPFTSFIRHSSPFVVCLPGIRYILSFQAVTVAYTAYYISLWRTSENVLPLGMEIDFTEAKDTLEPLLHCAFS